MAKLDDKLEELKRILQSLDSALIAFSGGVDSTFLLKVSSEVLKKNLLAVTAYSPIRPSSELIEAKKIAKRLGVKHLSIETKEFCDPEFINNPPDRCYICKKELFSQLKKIAGEKGLKYIIDGSNLNDLNDFRPGRQACQEFGVRSPLIEAKITKEEVRNFSQKASLETWNKPAFTCLATRIPYGDKISVERLKRIDKAESFLKNLGLRGIRVRDHGDIARIEILREDIPLLLKENLREKIVKKLDRLGFLYKTLDLEGYQSGSLNKQLVNKK